MIFVKRLFQSRSRKFYLLFTQVAGNIREMDLAFNQFIFENDPAVLKTQLKRIEALEHENDMTTHKLIIELGRNFITPFDREDIHTLATSLDDIADYMYAIAKQRINYAILKVPRETQIVAEKLKPAIKLLCEILNDLSDNKQLLKLSVLSSEIKSILHKCDHMIDMALSDLYARKKDVIETIKLTDHYAFLQALIDKCGDSINVIDSIIIKYS